MQANTIYGQVGPYSVVNGVRIYNEERVTLIDSPDKRVADLKPWGEAMSAYCVDNRSIVLNAFESRERGDIVVIDDARAQKIWIGIEQRDQRRIVFVSYSNYFGGQEHASRKAAIAACTVDAENCAN